MTPLARNVYTSRRAATDETAPESAVAGDVDLVPGFATFCQHGDDPRANLAVRVIADRNMVMPVSSSLSPSIEIKLSFFNLFSRNKNRRSPMY